MNAGFGVALSILMVIGYLYYLNVRAMTNFDRMVERSQAVILNLEGLLSAMKDVENGEHIFTIIGDERSLEPYRSAIGQVDQYLAALNTLTKNHPAQQNRVYRVEPLIRERLAETAKTIDVRKKEGYLAAAQREFSGRHKFLTDEIRGQLDEAKSLVMQHLERRRALKEASTKSMLLAVYAGSSLSLVVLLTIYVLLKRDITKRKRAELKFRGLLESAPEAVAIVNEKGDICLVNSQTVNLFGYERGELFGQKIEMLVPERFRNSHVNHRTNYFQDPRVRRIGTGKELYGLCKDGREFPADISLSPLSTDEGVLVIATIRDITESKRKEDILRFSEARYRALFSDNPTMIVILDTELTILSVNPVCAGLLGYMTDELEGRSVLELFHEDDRPIVSEQLWICLQNPEQVYHWQIRKIRKDGELLWVEETAQAVHDLNGMRNIMMVCQDNTAHKESEDEIRRLNTELAARNAELETAYLELEAFNYTVAHGLRGPLNIISSYCQVLNEVCGDKLDKQCIRYVHETYDGTMRMNRLIEALLNFSRLAHAKLKRERVDLSSMANEVSGELKVTEASRRVEIRIADGMVTDGDASLLRVVLVNILGNAWKYTATREEALIEFGTQEIEGKPVYFIRDNGPGFENADVDKIFKPFQRLPGSEECRGFGIGLATVERIIRRHGGSVWAEGEPGKGAVFYFTFHD
jgi:PAS domain S-box-containing protein